MRPQIGPSVVLAFVLVAVTAASWGWQRGIVRAAPVEVREEGWKRVKDEYPLASANQPPVSFSSATAEAVARANPFSPTRRVVPRPISEGTGTEEGWEETGEFLTPRLIYRGQIRVGQSLRAIMEDAATKKTHFLEVGQEVAGFKVLDMTQRQVIVWNFKTQEEVVVPLVSSTRFEREETAPP
ncbi:MAG: hypothetical protein HYS71_00580 [Candidatus Omnitrophica bacterium]|nr:hypothetical protein [Candidatus Omnitrophota bacterium]